MKPLARTVSIAASNSVTKPSVEGRLLGWFPMWGGSFVLARLTTGEAQPIPPLELKSAPFLVSAEGVDQGAIHVVGGELPPLLRGERPAALPQSIDGHHELPHGLFVEPPQEVPGRRGARHAPDASDRDEDFDLPVPQIQYDARGGPRSAGSRNPGVEPSVSHAEQSPYGPQRCHCPPTNGYARASIWTLTPKGAGSIATKNHPHPRIIHAIP